MNQHNYCNLDIHFGGDVRILLNFAHCEFYPFISFAFWHMTCAKCFLVDTFLDRKRVWLTRLKSRGIIVSTHHGSIVQWQKKKKKCTLLAPSGTVNVSKWYTALRGFDSSRELQSRLSFCHTHNGHCNWLKCGVAKWTYLKQKNKKNKT